MSRGEASALAAHLDDPTPTAWTVRVFDSPAAFDQIPASEWKRCTTGLGMVFQHGMVRATYERGGFRVLCALNGERLAGFVCAFLVTTPGTKDSHPAQTLTDPGYLRLRNATTDLSEPELAAARAELLDLMTPVMVVRNGLESRVATAADLGEAERIEVTELLLETLLAQAHDEDACVVFARVRSDDTVLRAVLRNRGWGDSLVSAGAGIDLRGCATFDDYLRRLPSKRRNTIRRERKVFAQAGLAMHQEPARAFIEQFAPIEAQNYRKYGVEMSVDELIDRRTAWADGLGDQLKAAGCRIDGRLVAGVLFHQHAGRIDVLSVGLDYDSVANTYAYFNAVFYWPIEHALDQLVTTVDFGTEALTGKLLRGADPYPLHLMTEPRLGDHAVVREWLGRLDRHNRASSWFRAREDAVDG